MGFIPLLRGVEKAWQGAGCCLCFSYSGGWKWGEIWQPVLGMLQPPPPHGCILRSRLGADPRGKKSQRKSSFCPWEVAFLRCGPGGGGRRRTGVSSPGARQRPQREQNRRGTPPARRKGAGLGHCSCSAHPRQLTARLDHLLAPNGDRMNPPSLQDGARTPPSPSLPPNLPPPPAHCGCHGAVPETHRGRGRNGNRG